MKLGIPSLFIGTILLAYCSLPYLAAAVPPNSMLWNILNSPLVTTIVGAALGGLVATLGRIRNWSPTMPWPICFTRLGIHESHRDVIRRESFSDRFGNEQPAGVVKLSEDGWRFSGDGQREQCSVNTTVGFSGRGFVIAAQVRPVERQKKNRYWRVGFVLKADTDGQEAVRFHIDSHDLVVAYLQEQKTLTVPCGGLVDQWTLIELSVGGTVRTKARLVHGRVNNRSYFLGTLPKDCSVEALYITAWSDKQRDHVVEVRDVSIETSVA